MSFVFKLQYFILEGNIVLIALEVLGLLSMATFMFVAIWGFIILKQIYSQLKYRNYLLEKLNHNMIGIKKDDTAASSENKAEAVNSNNKATENSTDIL